MRYSRHIIIVTALGLFISCNNNKTKPDEPGSPKDLDTTASTITSSAATEAGPAGKQSSARSADPGNSDKNAILANIDQYLISKPSISAATLVIENTLKDARILKAYAEVTIVDAAGKNLRTDFLIFENIQPGDSKSVRIPDVTNGIKVISNIVRLKSDELTNGEMILVGSRYVPK